MWHDNLNWGLVYKKRSYLAKKTKKKKNRQIDGHADG